MLCVQIMCYIHEAHWVYPGVNIKPSKYLQFCDSAPSAEDNRDMVHRQNRYEWMNLVVRLLFIFLSMYLNMVPSGPVDLVSNEAFSSFQHAITRFMLVQFRLMCVQILCLNLHFSSFFVFFWNDQWPELSFLTYVNFAIDTHTKRNSDVDLRLKEQLDILGNMLV